MGGIWGWLGPVAPASPDKLAGMAGAGKTPATATLLGEEGTAMAGSGDAILLREGDVWLGLTGQPRWLPDGDPGDPRIPARLAAAFRRDGEAALSRLGGAFALALVEPEAGRILVATDRMGREDLFVARAGEDLVFGSRLGHLLGHPALSPEIDPAGIHHYLYFHVVPSPRSIYRGIRRLSPGHRALAEGGDWREEPYWRPSFRPEPPASLSRLKAEFRQLLREAVGRAVAANGQAGAFLSGGTDSSSVVGFLGEITGEAPRTFSIGFVAESYDETRFARIAADHFGTDHHERFVTPEDVVDAVPRIAEGYEQPFGNASAVPTFYCADLARSQGVGLLLGGDGGDELFGGNSRYAKQWLFSLYQRVPGPIRRGLLEPALLEASWLGRAPGLRKLRSYVDQARIPLPDRLQTYNILHEIDSGTVFTPALADQLANQTPMELLRSFYHQHPEGATCELDRILALDWKFTLADDDLRKVTGAAHLAGVETAFPFLDEEVVEFSACLPPRLKVRRTRLRWLFKQALREFLPQEVLTKRKQGFGLPFGIWLTRHPGLRELAGDSLAGLKGRDLLRPDFIDTLFDRRLPEHPAYYGTMVWVLMMLEQWLRTRPFPVSRP